MIDCPTCAYRTTCNQRYRGQDCKYCKGETMSDIQPTEADRSLTEDLCFSPEALEAHNSRIRADAVKAEREAEGWHALCDVMEKRWCDACDERDAALAAVKAEREKIAILEARIAELTKPYKPIYSEPKAYVSDGPVVDSYLSDDQEAHRG